MKMIYLDCEMNCPSKWELGEIIKIAAHRVVDNKVVDSFEEYIALADRSEKLFWNISILTDIYDADLKSARSFEDVFHDFIIWTNNDMVAVYGSGDVPCLNFSLKKAGIKDNKKKKQVSEFIRQNIKDISKDIVMSHYHKCAKRRLIDVAKDLNIRIDKESLHDPKYDAHLLFTVHKKLGYPTQDYLKEGGLQYVR